MIVNHKTSFLWPKSRFLCRLAFVVKRQERRAGKVSAGSVSALWTGVFSLAKGVYSARKILDKIRKKIRCLTTQNVVKNFPESGIYCAETGRLSKWCAELPETTCGVCRQGTSSLPFRHAFRNLKGRLFCGFCRPFYKRGKVKLLIAKRGPLLRGVARNPPSAVLLANSPFLAGMFR